MSIKAILALLVTVAEAGGRIWSIWAEYSDTIRDAEENNDGKVDPAVYAELVKRCEEMLLALRARAEEAAKP